MGIVKAVVHFEKVLKDKVKGQYRKKKGTRVVSNALSKYRDK